MVAETLEASKDQQSESTTGENNTCTCSEKCGLPEDALLSAIEFLIICHPECKQSFSRRRSLKNGTITSTVCQRAPLITYGKMPRLELPRSRILVIVICSRWEMETKAKYIS